MKVRLFLVVISLSSLLFLQTYCTNICQFIDGLKPDQLLRNLGFIFILHLVYRELLYFGFSNSWKNVSLPRQAYYLSMISWVLAGISAFILHASLYPDFPMGSHLKLFTSYIILGAGILSQLEYILFEMSYKKIAIEKQYTIFNEKLSQRILETFLIFTLAPIITLILIIGRYSFEGVIDKHVSMEILYMSTIMLVAAITLAIVFRNALKKDTKIIIENLQNIEDGNYRKTQTINRPDELGEISYSIKDMASSIEEGIEQVESLNEEIINTQKEIIYTMGEIAETRSKETGNHVKRVAEYSKILALKSGLGENEAEMLKLASPMHDIGKVGIPDNILNKPDKLTADEFEIMKTHASLGYEMLKHSNKKILQAAAIVSKEHHEKYNGEGYPNGLKGDEIHIYARITAVADVFDALGSDRVYKKKWDDKDIFEYLKKESGESFDPKLIDIFFENIDEILSFRDEHQD
ncbi:HD-GYP domain-containing protein [Sulfurovum sp.]|uniref:HD-GYP domain-containing protein n=1 Tax=Sulfurovum sp. TaxID=1969726 RepID=UPI0038D409FB